MLKNEYSSCAQLLKVIAHPTRLAILDSLKRETRCVNDVCELLNSPQPNISQHLSVLRREGIVNVSDQGTKRCYSIANPEIVKSLLNVLNVVQREKYKITD